MKWALIIVGALAALVAIAFMIGSLRPAGHVASITVRLAQPDSVVWATVSDFSKVPEWFTEVESAERIADVDGQPAWREKYGGFPVTNVVRVWDPPRKLVREILPSGSFSGMWTIELAPDGPGTTITLTEFGHVGNPLFRAMLMFGDNEKTMRDYVTALEKRLVACG
jgi:uncharacterized protein YndB with AHSA1/START domain